MAVGTGGGGNQCIKIWLKYVHSSVDIGNHRYTYVQNCILLKYKCDLKKIKICPPPSQNCSYGLDT